jgi:hypothetical protein
MMPIQPRWHLGGGAHYSRLATSERRKHNLWPQVAAMYTNHQLRLNIQYLLPVRDQLHQLHGVLGDLRIPLGRRLSWRQRWGLYTFHNPYEARPSRHALFNVNWEILYAFGRPKESD